MIILPTLYDGGIEPENPKEYDIWQNSYTNEIFIHARGRWFKIQLIKKTNYTEEQRKEIKAREIENKDKLQFKIDKYEDFFRQFKEIVEEMEDKS